MADMNPNEAEYSAFLLNKIEREGGSTNIKMLQGELSQLDKEVGNSIGIDRMSLMKFMKKFPDLFMVDGTTITASGKSVLQVDSFPINSNPLHVQEYPDKIDNGEGVVISVLPSHGFIVIKKPRKATVYFTAKCFGQDYKTLLTDFTEVQPGKKVCFHAYLQKSNTAANYRATKVWFPVEVENEVIIPKTYAKEKKHDPMRNDGEGKIQKLHEGFGFIMIDDDPKNIVFFHKSKLCSYENVVDLNKILKPGDIVEFSAQRAKKESKARWIAFKVWVKKNVSKEEPVQKKVVGNKPTKKERKLIKGVEGKLYPRHNGTVIKFDKKLKSLADADSCIFYNHGKKVEEVSWEFGDGQEVKFNAIQIKSSPGWKAKLAWVGIEPNIVLSYDLGNYTDEEDNADVLSNESSDVPSASQHSHNQYNDTKSAGRNRNHPFNRFESIERESSGSRMSQNSHGSYRSSSQASNPRSNSGQYSGHRRPESKSLEKPKVQESNNDNRFIKKEEDAYRPSYANWYDSPYPAEEDGMSTSSNETQKKTNGDFRQKSKNNNSNAFIKKRFPKDSDSYDSASCNSTEWNEVDKLQKVLKDSCSSYSQKPFSNSRRGQSHSRGRSSMRRHENPGQKKEFKPTRKREDRKKHVNSHNIPFQRENYDDIFDDDEDSAESFSKHSEEYFSCQSKYEDQNRHQSPEKDPSESDIPSISTKRNDKYLDSNINVPPSFVKSTKHIKNQFFEEFKNTNESKSPVDMNTDSDNENVKEIFQNRSAEEFENLNQYRSTIEVNSDSEEVNKIAGALATNDQEANDRNALNHLNVGDFIDQNTAKIELNDCKEEDRIPEQIDDPEEVADTSKLINTEEAANLCELDDNDKNVSSKCKASIKVFRDVEGQLSNLFSKYGSIENIKYDREDTFFWEDFYYNGVQVCEKYDDLRKIAEIGQSVKYNYYEIVDDSGESWCKISLVYLGKKPKNIKEITPKDFIKENNLHCSADTVLDGNDLSKSQKTVNKKPAPPKRFLTSADDDDELVDAPIDSTEVDETSNSSTVTDKTNFAETSSSSTVTDKTNFGEKDNIENKVLFNSGAKKKVEIPQKFLMSVFSDEDSEREETVESETLAAKVSPNVNHNRPMEHKENVIFSVCDKVMTIIGSQNVNISSKESVENVANIIAKYILTDFETEKTSFLSSVNEKCRRNEVKTSQNQTTETVLFQKSTSAAAADINESNHKNVLTSKEMATSETQTIVTGEIFSQSVFHS